MNYHYPTNHILECQSIAKGERQREDGSIERTNSTLLFLTILESSQDRSMLGTNQEMNVNVDAYQCNRKRNEALYY